MELTTLAEKGAESFACAVGDLLCRDRAGKIDAAFATIATLMWVIGYASCSDCRSASG